MNKVDLSLYGILDPARSRGRPLPELACAAVAGGATLLQYRDKTGSTRAMVEAVRAIAAAVAGSGVPLLVNDRVDVALAAGAGGVHVGQDDMAAADARRLLGPEALIGLSVKTEAEARGSALEEIDYVCIGGVFDTQSKENPRSIGVDGWRALAAIVRARRPGLPVGAIAGIEVANAGQIMRAGSDGIAVISALFMAEDVAAATRRLREIVDGARVAAGESA
ncbi:thiamine phosphate synthase [Propylenella binzhouense]|uniref:Thiamine-phosphate synthase n=1 Tax=Propylenella binzhouense TaxID=2555902 RepID=A0A964T3Y9_9HYPH|nr:thiamine phosphate synthase [Propylenella binzhouense]MYZ47770.1 thiamine phosphate synthase [Propylenella binzhouense]